MDNKYIGLIIGLVVGVLMIGSLLVPTINDASTTEKTFINEGYYNMTEISEDTDVTIVWDHTKPTSFFVNDVEYSISVPPGKLVSIVGTDSMIVRYVSSSDGAANRVQAYSAQGFVQAAVTSNTDMTIEITSDAVTVTVGTTVKTVSITTGYYIDPNGTWAMKKSDETAYIHTSDSVMIFAGITNMGVDVGDVGVYGVGTIDDGMDIDSVPTNATPPTATFGDVTFSYNAVDGFNDLVLLSDCTFDITVSGTPDTTVTATYSYFIVPVEVTAELTDHLSTGEIAMIAVIPVLMIASLLIFAVRFVTRD